MLSAPVDLGPVGAQARNEPGRLQASSKIENSVVTTGSNSDHKPVLLQVPGPLELQHISPLGLLNPKD